MKLYNLSLSELKSRSDIEERSELKSRSDIEERSELKSRSDIEERSELKNRSDFSIYIYMQSSKLCLFVCISDLFNRFASNLIGDLGRATGMFLAWFKMF